MYQVTASIYVERESKLKRGSIAMGRTAGLDITPEVIEALICMCLPLVLAPSSAASMG